ncbi:MAG: amino acid adenylation domain-containing protein [Bacteroidales bacterium]|nr:amino acid adenylation domain-containing protein [Bacteroidales bacterium]
MDQHSENSNLIDQFDQAKDQFSDNIAIKGAGFQFSYNEFYNASCHFSTQLEIIGVRSGVPIGMCLDRSAEMLVGIFGILRLGSPYLPVEPSYPRERTVSIFKDANVRYVVTQSKNKDFIESLGLIPIVPEIKTEIPIKTVFAKINPTDNAYILFTSGSTGQPKGVMVGHSSVVNLIQSKQQNQPLEKGNVVLLKSPYTFDSSVWELFGWMIMGGTLYVSEPGDEKDPARLAQIIEEQGVNFMFFVPSMLGAFLDYISANRNSKPLQSLKWVSVGGEVLTISLVKQFYEELDGSRVKLINEYGPTETTVYATSFVCDPLESYTKIPIGESLVNNSIYILNEKMESVTQGEEGEICIGGAGVANGYLNRLELTAEKFVPDPFRGKGKMYRTGDVGRQLENGMFDFIGRRDFQVKLRGQRIEIGEIEYALQQIELLKESVVLFSKDRRGDDSLVAYLRPKIILADAPSENFFMSDNEFSALIIEKLSQFLPHYMIPSEMVVCRSFPLNANGKIDRKVLPPVSEIKTDEVVSIFEPQNETERQVYLIWQKILDRKTIGLEEEFFAAGGHSLKAIQAITSIIKQFGIEIPLKEFYNKMTLSKMCRLVDIMTNGEDPIIDDFERCEVDRMEFPLTPVQREMWVIHQFDATGLTHNIQEEFTIRGAIDDVHFIQSLKETVDVEEIFRSIFPSENGIPIQRILPTVDFSVPLIDLSMYEDVDKQEKYQNEILENGNVLFSFQKLPLFSFRLIKWDETEFRLLMTIHHLIFDGWSLNLFMKRLTQRYLGKKPEKSLYRSGDYAIWLNNHLSEEVKSSEIDFWQKALINIPERITLPLKRNPDWKKAGRYGNRLWWNISDEITKGVERLALKLSITPFSIVMSAYQLALGTAAKQSDLVVGTPFANRKHPMVTDLIGYYTNMVSIRFTKQKEDTFLSILQRCNDFSVASFSNASTPFGEIAKAVTSDFRLDLNPIYQTIMVMQNWPHESTGSDSFSISQREIGNNSAKIDLLLNVEKCDKAYTCWIEYDTMLYDIDFVNRMSAGINFLLSEMVKSVDRKVDLVASQLTEILKVPPVFSCMLVGEGALLIQCIDILFQKNVFIDCIISPDENVRKIARRLTIRCCSNLSDLTLFNSVDYIFSINNGFILKADFLAFAKEKTINYHDSLLPQYAGMYATNHALLNHEKVHGVSWHDVTNDIDAGEIYLTENIIVNSVDTAFSLNNRCFERSVWSFSALVDKIIDGNLMGVPQDQSKRTYFGLSKRPASMGFLFWNETVKNLSALLRACDAGMYSDNEFLLATVLLKGSIYFVSKSEVHKGRFGKIGEVVRYKNSWAIACADGCVVLGQLFNEWGEEADLSTLLVQGERIASPEAMKVAKIQQQFEKVAKYDYFWKNRLQQCDFIASPIISDIVTESLEEWIEIPEPTFASIQSHWPAQNLFTLVTAFASLFFLRLGRRTEGAIGIIPSNLTQINQDTYGYFAKWIPFYVALANEAKLEDSLISVFQSIEEIEKNETFCANLALRYSALRGRASQIPEIVIVESGIDLPIQFANSLVFEVGKNSIRVKGVTKAVAFAFIGFVSNSVANLRSLTAKIALFEDNLFANSYIPLNESSQKPIAKIEDVVSEFRKHVLYAPFKRAIYDHGNEITYLEFSADVSQLTVILEHGNVNKGDVVAINVSRSYYYFVSVMAILYRGATFLPIDPALPEERQRFMVDDSKAKLVITNNNSNHKIFETPILNLHEVTFVDYYDEEPIDVEPHSIAYIIYTSGSVGVPKGVKISRESLSNFVSAAISQYEITSQDRVLQFSNLGFDASIEEIFMTLGSGATLYLREEKILSPSEFIAYTLENKISVWDLPTAFWRQIIAFDGYKNVANELAVRLTIIGGEAVFGLDVDMWLSSSPQHRLINTYGPTETTVVALTYELTAKDELSIHIPIGRPLPGYHVKIIDENEHPLPCGVVGELLISGVGVAHGYVFASEAQNRAFGIINSPIEGAMRCYRTGDLVACDSTGLIYYLGRKDEQVKIRGYRVEPKGIAERIKKFSDIELCEVVHFEKKSGDKALAAFYTTKDQQLVDYQSIKQSLYELIPSYMVPQIAHQLESMPLTHNGKTDRRQLVRKAIDLSIAKAEPNTKLSDSVKQVMRHEDLELDAKEKEIKTHLLNLVHDIADDIEIDSETDLLFSGFDSLKFIRLIVSIERDFGVKISISDIYNFPTIKQLTKIISNYKPAIESEVITCLQKGDEKVVPLILIWGAGQHVIQFDELALRLDPRIPIYVLHAPLINGEIEIPDTVEALAWLYLNEIQRVLPFKKINLAGYSFGGFVVYEIARQLLKKNRQHLLENLFILDASSLFVKYDGQLPILFKTAIIRSKLWWFITRNPLKQVKTIVKNIADQIIVYKIRHRKIDAVLETESFSIPEFNDFLQLKAFELLHDYTIRPLDIKIELLTSQSHLKFGGLTMKWERYAKLGVNSHFIPCFHGEIFLEDNVDMVAEWFLSKLNV